MKSAVALLVALLVSFIGLAGASDSSETVIEYTSPVGGSEAYCPTFGNIPGAVAQFVRGMSDAVGQDVPDPLSFCGPIPDGTTSLHVAVADDVFDQVLVTVSQLDAENKGNWDRFCGAGTFPIDPASVVYTVHLLPYGQTSGTCLDAGPPTHGFVTLTWE